MTQPIAAPAPSKASGDSPRRGRPRGEGVEDRILAAGLEIVQEVGIDGLTVSAVIARSGVARATVYRRWATRAALVEAVVHEVKGRRPYPLSGDIETDLRRAAEQTRTIYAEPQFQAFLPMLVRDLLRADATTGVSEAFDRIAPNHRRIAEEYVEQAAAAGLREDVDPYLVGNIILGALLARLISTGRAPTKATADQVVDVLMNGLRRR
jgi:AcrR family transcriptional regulator